MKRPKRRNSKIDLRRLRGWANEFAGYRHNVSEDRIRKWISQFRQEHHDLAARVLDCVDYFPNDQIAAAFRESLKGLNGWDIDPTKRIGSWRFVAYSASAGESGDSMLHKFRHANNLAARAHDQLFIHRSDILREGLGPDDAVVLIDDFVGSGDQACNSWDNVFGELLADIGHVFLVVVAACQSAVKRVSAETGLEVVPNFELSEADNVFSEKCKVFTTDEKNALLGYCKKADFRKPKGHRDCGVLVVFAHTCPNNSIPILHKSHSKWEAVFRRYN